MIPLSDHNPVSRRAILVPLLIVANVLVFVFLQPSFGGSEETRAIKQLEFNVCNASIPYEVIHQETLADADPGNVDAFGRAVGEHQRQECPNKSVWVSILASLFFHGGLLHLGFNMLFLWVFGNNIEDRLGIPVFAAFYVVSGVAATFAQSLATPDSTVPLIGASGAIAGILGAYLVLYPRARIRTLLLFIFITVADLPAIVVLGLWFVLQVFQGVGPGGVSDNVAYLAHVGGFVTGMLLILPFRARLAPRRTPLEWML